MSGQAVANVYLGSSEFAAVVLRTLAASAHRPLLVVTPPDRPRGRGRKLAPPPVAELARELELPLHQTESVNRPASTRALLDVNAAVGCVCAFGQLIKEPLLSELPMLNVHPSLLPRWRGAAPLERALIAGDERTGVCVMRLSEGLDSGPVAMRREVEIGARQTYGELATELALLGGELLVAALDRRAQGSLLFEEQGEQGVTYAEKIEPADRRLDPGASAEQLDRVIRALTPHIGAFVELEGGERLGIRAAEPIGSAAGLEPGAVAVRDDRLLIGCGEGALVVSELQPPGKRAMPAADWLRGYEAPARVRLS